ncbi:MAG TPA: sensor domain-containing diguanylate cyclase, partial [Bacillota bacterium]|nr:sensor domain-containing diguanylate cyclase [Bacillota bacterium]
MNPIQLNKIQLPTGKSFKKNRTAKIFSISLAQIRLKLVLINAALIGLAVWDRGTQVDYIVVIAYFFINFFSLVIPGLRPIITRPLRFIFFGMDLMVVGFMMARTGGSQSELYPLLFIPVMVAVLRFKYKGIITWCSVMAAILIVASCYAKTLLIIPLIFKTSYLYLAGVVGGYLINHTFTVTEEVSKRLARWNIDLQRLNNFSLEVTGSSDLDGVFKQTLKAILQSNPSQMAAIMMFNDDGILKIYDSTGWEDKWLENYEHHPLKRESLTLAPIIIFKNPLRCSDIKKHPELTKVFTGIPVDSLYAFPLVVENEVVGVLMITNPSVRTMPEQESRIMASIAHQASLAIQNVAHLKTEKKKADTDGLTGLFNRGYFNEQIEEAVKRALERPASLSLVLMDLDNFKHYNDTFGHPAGDQLLKVIANTITGAVRDHDIVARYGGEEFAIILKDTSNQLALDIAERIRLSVANLPKGTLKSPVTLSLGVATIPEHAMDRSALLEYADRSLYQAK